MGTKGIKDENRVELYRKETQAVRENGPRGERERERDRERQRETERDL